MGHIINSKSQSVNVDLKKTTNHKMALSLLNKNLTNLLNEATYDELTLNYLGVWQNRVGFKLDMDSSSDNYRLVRESVEREYGLISRLLRGLDIVEEFFTLNVNNKEVDNSFNGILNALIDIPFVQFVSIYIPRPGELNTYIMLKSGFTYDTLTIGERQLIIDTMAKNTAVGTYFLGDHLGVYTSRFTNVNGSGNSFINVSWEEPITKAITITTTYKRKKIELLDYDVEQKLIDALNDTITKNFIGIGITVDYTYLVGLCRNITGIDISQIKISDGTNTITDGDYITPNNQFNTFTIVIEEEVDGGAIVD